MKPKQRYSSYLLASYLLLSLHSYAQNSSLLKLEDAIHLALQNNQSIKIAKEKNIQAATNLQEAKNRRLPDFNINGQLLHVNQPLIDLRVKLNNSGSSSGSSAPGGGSGWLWPRPRRNWAWPSRRSKSPS